MQAEAQGSPADAEVDSPVSSAVFAAVKGLRVTLFLRTGGATRGLFLGTEGDLILLAVEPSGEIVKLPRGAVVEVRVVLAPPQPQQPPMVLPWRETGPRPPPEPPPPLPPSHRHFGIELGMPPAVSLDVEASKLYAFGTLSLMMPLLTVTENGQAPFFSASAVTHLWAFMLGMGLTFPISPQSRWRVDVYALGGGSNWNSGEQNPATAFAALGLGFGFHVTLDNGFTIGFKFPALGVGTATSGIGVSNATALGAFFSTSLVALPPVTLGYRF